MGGIDGFAAPERERDVSPTAGERGQKAKQVRRELFNNGHGGLDSF
jgi:hypothetical protein